MEFLREKPIDKFTMLIGTLATRSTTGNMGQQYQHSEAEIWKAMLYCIYTRVRFMLTAQCQRALDLHIRTVGREYGFRPSSIICGFYSDEFTGMADFPNLLGVTLCWSGRRGNLSAHALLLVRTLNEMTGRSEAYLANELCTLLMDYNPYYSSVVKMIQS